MHVLTIAGKLISTLKPYLIIFIINRKFYCKNDLYTYTALSVEKIKVTLKKKIKRYIRASHYSILQTLVHLEK